jgi:hypothetical protein
MVVVHRLIATRTTTFFAFAFGALAWFSALVLATPPAAAQQQRPNVVIIWGDDIGQSNVSAYSRGVMGYRTPNIDRLATEGVIFTDYYGEQSCTAGRASFITGQSGLRTGMTKVGLPGWLGFHLSRSGRTFRVVNNAGALAARSGPAMSLEEIEQ